MVPEPGPDPAASREAERLRANLPKLSLLGASHMFLVAMPVVVPFFRAHALDLRQVYVLQAVFSVSTLLLEVPSGYVADLLGRKRSLVLASVFYGASFSLLARADGFAGFVVFEVLAAVGVAFFSGTDLALLYASLRGAPEDARSGGRAVGRLVFASQLGETAAALIGGLLAGVSLQLPVTVNAVTAWAPLLVALTLHEPEGERLGRADHRENVRAVARVLFGQGARVSLVLVNQVWLGAATLLAVWAFQPYWTERGIPLAHFGWLWAAQNLAVALTARAAHRVEDAVGFRAVAALAGVLPVAGCFGMAFGAGAAGVALGLAFPLCRGLNQVVLRNELNAHVPEPMRATANSVVALGMRLVFAGCGPLLGWSMDEMGAAAALRFAAIPFAALAVLTTLPLARTRRP